MPVNLTARYSVVGFLPIAPWSDETAVVTFPDVVDDEGRVAFRRRFGHNLARIRRDLTKFSQGDVAERLGIDAESYGRVERGTREAKAYEMVIIADMLGVPADWLLDPTDSLAELDRRLALLRRAAAEAARGEGEGPAPASGDGKDAPRGKR